MAVPLDKSNTRPAPFSALTLDSPTTPQQIQVPMMFKVFENQKNVSISQVPGKYTAVRLPYQDSAGLAAVFVLPNETYSSIGEAAGHITGGIVLDPETWSPLSQELWLSLPKFKVETQLPLKQVGSNSRFQTPNQI